MPIDTLLDSNVLIAALAEEHLHHGPSRRLLETDDIGRFCVSTHNISETFNILTRPGGPYRRDPRQVWRALEALATQVQVIGLTPAQSLDAVRRYAQGGGVGPRLYDHLIGEAARHAGCHRLITWNTGHLRALFPQLEVVTPEGVA